MSTLTTYLHDPDAKLDYSIDWSAWLSTDDEIETSSWTVSPTGPVLSDSSVNAAKTIATIWFEGGISGLKYILTNHIITTDGREDDRSITIKIIPR